MNYGDRESDKLLDVASCAVIDILVKAKLDHYTSFNGGHHASDLVCIMKNKMKEKPNKKNRTIYRTILSGPL